jgi:hypothetical protein
VADIKAAVHNQRTATQVSAAISQRIQESCSPVLLVLRRIRFRGCFDRFLLRRFFNRLWILAEFSASQ